MKSHVTTGDIGSDHVPVVTTLKSKVDGKTRTGISIKLWAGLVDGGLENFTLTNNVENDIDRLNEIFMDAKDASTFEFKPRKRNLPSEIRHKIKIQHTLLKLKKKAETDLIR